MKKFELTTNTKIVFGKTLFQIRALISFGNVKAGDLGGWVEKEDNLSQVSGDAWVYGDAQVYGNAAITWFSNVGSENGTLTAFKCEVGIKVNRGCFFGTLEEFVSAVIDRHGDSAIAKQYMLLVEFIKLRLGE